MYASVNEFETSLSYEQIGAALKLGTFSGKFTTRNSLGESFYLLVENGKIVDDTAFAAMSANARQNVVDYCTDLKSVGVCAAIKMENMNWLEYGLCVVRIAECWIEQNLYCYVEGCQELKPTWPDNPA